MKILRDLSHSFTLMPLRELSPWGAFRMCVVGLAAVALSDSATAQATGLMVPPKAAVADEETIQLRPFEVIADPSDTYQALNTSSISGTNRSLEKLPITAEIYNATMLQDLGTSDLVELLTTRFTGIGAGEAGGGTSAPQGTLSGDRLNMQGFSIRGLTAYPRRNGFMYHGDLAEGFASERVEVIRGPQSLLYGNNPAGGVINVATKKAIFGRSFYSGEVKVDKNDSVRYQLDANVDGKLMSRRVAVRLAGMKADQKTWREIARQKTQGGYVEAAIELFPSSETTLRLEIEDRSETSVQTNRRTLVSGIPSIVPNNSTLSVLLAQHHAALAQVAGGMINWEKVDSLAGNSYYRRRWEHFETLTLSSRIAPWLRGQLVVHGLQAFNDQGSASGLTALLAPLTGGNPLNDWAVGYRPGGAEVRVTGWGVRGTLNATFAVKKFAQNQLIVGGERTTPRDRSRNFNYNFYEVDAGGAFITNQSQLNTANGGRTLIPIQWVAVAKNLTGFVDPERPRSYTVDGRTYVWDYQKRANSAFATPDNPFGFNGGSSGAAMLHSETKGAFAALFTTWLDGRVDTLLGIRHDNLLQQQLNSAVEVTGAGTTGNVGLVWKASRSVSLYAGASSNFTPGGINFQTRYDGGALPNGRGESLEGGMKVNALEGRLSGSVTLYETSSKNQIVSLTAPIQDAMAPAGISGNYWSGIRSPSFNYDAATKGMEVTLSGRPAENWRCMFGYSLSAGREGGSVVLPFYYNDEFRTNPQGQVLLGDGTPLRAPVDPTIRMAADGKTYAANIATQIMTVGILRNGDANGFYRAQLSPDNGHILNAAQLGLSISGVGTGRLGLPISEHQLGFVPLTQGVVVSRGGDRTIGFPKHSITLTSMHDFKKGKLRGFSVGANGRADFDTILYRYTNAAEGNAYRSLRGKDLCLINLIVRHKMKLGKRVEWQTQINVNNVFNTQKLVIYPNVVTGVPENAGFRNNPLNWVWTNGFTF